MEIRRAAGAGEWGDVAQLLFAYQCETAVEVGELRPRSPEEVWLPVRRETTDPSSLHSTFLVAYDSGRPIGGVALVPNEAHSLLLRRCYVLPSERRQGIATALVAESVRVAENRGVARVILDVLPSRKGAIAAWRTMGFVDAEPWGDPAMAYFERRMGDGVPRPWLGVPYGEVTLRESDHRWAEVFAHHAEVLRRALGERAVAVEHVGSTAVPGLVAKPIVDIAVLIGPAAATEGMVDVLAAAGYLFRGDKGDAGGELFVAEDRPGRRIAHVHVVGAGDPQWHWYLAVRDRLRSDPDARRAYTMAKRELASRFPADRSAYTAAKGPVLAELAQSSEVTWS